MQLVIDPTGDIRAIYGETIELTHLGEVTIARGSHVEPNERAQWFANLSPVLGPKLGPFSQRSQALAAEIQWLETNWLVPK